MRRIITTLFILLLLFPSSVSAHLPGQKPFFKINGKFTNIYPVTGSSLPDLILPQDIGPEIYMVNKEISFEIDQTMLPVPKEIVDKTTFDWDLGDGTKGSGLSNTHSYKKVGSYLITVNAKYEESTEPQLIQSTLIHIVPNASYKVPKAVIVVNGKKITDPLTQDIKFNSKQPVHFDASLSEANSSKIIEYFWDFGDGQSSKKKTLDHAYSQDYPLIFPLLRIKDTNGFVIDTYAQLEGNDMLSPKDSKEPNNLFLIISIVTGAAVGVGAAAYFFVRKRKKK